MQLFPSEEEAEKWLQSDDGDYEVNQAADIGLMNGVQSVPFIIVQVRMTGLLTSLRQSCLILALSPHTLFPSFQDGSDHSSEVMDHASLMRMFNIQASVLG